MESSLLATKLRIPPQTHRVVHRARLVDAIERGIPHYRLVLVSAPAGYGKTTLLSEWAHASRFPIVWLSVNDEDNDIARFFRYLLTGWEDVQPGVSESPLGLLLGSMMPDSDAVLSAFINVANDLNDRTVFVLDDIHLIDDPSVYNALTFLLDHLPPNLHFVLAGRGEPPLPLSRYRARHELLELGTAELHFQPEETRAFLSETMGLDLAPERIAPLQSTLEGWVAGLQLVALTLRRHRESSEPLVVTGRHRFIADYLNDDVLVHLPDELRLFMLQTSILDRLSGPLCDAVTGWRDGQEMLEALERERLFLMPLDDSREWFRYHRLFADVLRAELNRLQPDDVAALNGRAARWYMASDLPEPAVRHAVAGNDPDFVIRIFERYLSIKLNSGEVAVVVRWLDSLPAEWFATYPILNVFRGAALAFSGEFEACLRSVDDAERRLTDCGAEDATWQLAVVTAMRCFIACIQNDLARAETYAGRALQDLRQDSRSFRATIYHALGDTYRRNGHWKKAQDCYRRVPSVIDAPGFHLQATVQSVHVFGALADLELQQGRLRKAAGYWTQALEAMQEPESWGRLELPLTGWVHIRLGEVLYEWNGVTEAWVHLSQGLERVELGGDARSMIAGYLAASRLKLTEGSTETAAEYLELARPLIEKASFPEWGSRFDRLQLEVWLVQDRLRAAVNWADEMPENGALQERLEPEIAQLALARVLIVKGDAPSVRRAMELLEQRLHLADADGRMGVQIEALALQSIAHWSRGERADALTSLEHALRLAEPEGYTRLFADLGLPMARLLQEARSRSVIPDYVARLLAACGTDLAVASGPHHTLPEPLTQREHEVLELVAAGLTNREIADRLIISPQTVKKHADNIYGKLGVRSRTEAAARARELDLLA